MGWNDVQNSPAFIEKCNREFEEQFGKEVTLHIPINSWVTHTVQGIQIGDLAVTFSDIKELGLVTHVPTLTRFDNAIPDGEWTQEQLIAWCWKVQQSTGHNWTALRAYNNSNYKTIDPLILKQVQEYCLSIPIE